MSSPSELLRMTADRLMTHVWHMRDKGTAPLALTAKDYEEQVTALRLVANRLEHPTEEMRMALFNSYTSGLKMSRQDHEAAREGLVAAIAAALRQGEWT